MDRAGGGGGGGVVVLCIRDTLQALRHVELYK